MGIKYMVTGLKSDACDRGVARTFLCGEKVGMRSVPALADQAGSE